MASKFELNDTTPAAPVGKVNVKWLSDVDGNVSAHIDPALVGSNQTPWLSNIDAAGFSLSNAGALFLGNSLSASGVTLRVDGHIDNLYLVATPSASAGAGIAFMTGVAGGVETERVRITAAGNVGIGSLAATSPDPAAITSKQYLFLGSEAPGGLHGALTLSGNETVSGTEIGIVNFANYNISAAEKRVGAINCLLDGAANSGAINFYTLNAGTIGLRMRIAAAGNVGIGTGSPAYKLDVAGDTNVAGNLVVGIAAGGDPYILLKNASATKACSLNFNLAGANTVEGGLIIQRRTPAAAYEASLVYLNINTGYVGIGTLTPSAKLHVHAAGATGCALYLSNAAASNYTYLEHGADGNAYLHNPGVSTIYIYTQSAQRMNITAGEVGIQTLLRPYAREVIYSNVASAAYSAAAIEVRQTLETGGVVGNNAYAPRISFHWTGAVANQIGMDGTGAIRTFDNPGTGYAAFACAALSMAGSLYLSTPSGGDGITFYNTTAATRGMGFHHNGSGNAFEIFVTNNGALGYMEALRIQKDGHVHVNPSGVGYLWTQWINTVGGNSGVTAISRIYASDDAFIRYYTPGNFASVMLPYFNTAQLAMQDVTGLGLFQNGWSNFGGGFHGLSFHKDGMGYVTIRGMITGGTGVANTVIFTLPVGYRPTAILLFQTRAIAGSIRIDVMSDGVVRFGEACSNNAWVSLSGITFSTL